MTTILDLPNDLLAVILQKHGYKTAFTACLASKLPTEYKPVIKTTWDSPSKDAQMWKAVEYIRRWYKYDGRKTEQEFVFTYDKMRFFFVVTTKTQALKVYDMTNNTLPYGRLCMRGQYHDYQVPSNVIAAAYAFKYLVSIKYKNKLPT